MGREHSRAGEELRQLIAAAPSGAEADDLRRRPASSGLLEELLLVADQGELTWLLADPRLGDAVDVLYGMHDARDLGPLLTTDLDWLREVVSGPDDRLGGQPEDQGGWRHWDGLTRSTRQLADSRPCARQVSGRRPPCVGTLCA